ncbi:uncharacterized protein EKO05_0000630 [Ascochyta rabiei]|uniref:Uncharacterized protein n=1 Tax=Didymella rabiei TaxID=5454 RepID=A0A163HQ40_DIDRA|nr:uncharacterized protein EKO05_0000630 [Ascochyta rabiei]KZM25407.1 hypothetical protein ST47_g3552 [Ascochyta rabiei]UPX09953.1 hypothetical protein EKO05_0000630 [Ascochyta rabiei]
MSGTQHPHEPPPSYEAATGPSSSSEPTPGLSRVSTDGPGARTERNGIPMERRRSMEDELRELPPGWVRTFDPESHHQFFVDTTADPPRSIWTHPYDDEQFLSTLSPEERKKHSRMKRTVTLQDLAAEDSDDDDAHAPRAARGKSAEPELKGFHKFSRKLKDKVTGSTHTEREQQRVRRAEQERQAYQAHLRARQALIRAMETGEPQFLCKDHQGKDVYVTPPNGYAPRGAYGYNPYGNPYARGAYANPNVRYMRPAQPYGRPYGYGYGGGAGLPIAAGFLGGALLGGALF